jgi:hypothetical protein
MAVKKLRVRSEELGVKSDEFKLTPRLITLNS